VRIGKVVVQCGKRLAVGMSALYAVILVLPALLGGSVLDKSRDSFRGQMTSLGGAAMRTRAEQTLRWGRQAVGKNRVSICEIGPGRGTFAACATQDTDCLYWAIDMDPAPLARIPKAIGCYCCRVPPMPSELPLVDLIVCENVLEHMANYTEAREFLSACHGSLQRGGAIVLRFPEIREARWRFWEEAPDHAYVTSLRRMMNLLGEVGFHTRRQGLSLDHWTGLTGWLASRTLRCFPWQTMHDLCYEPWLSSPWSRLAAKTRHAYVVAIREKT
jgi:hypothetical protein